MVSKKPTIQELTVVSQLLIYSTFVNVFLCRGTIYRDIAAMPSTSFGSFLSGPHIDVSSDYLGRILHRAARTGEARLFDVTRSKLPCIVTVMSLSKFPTRAEDARPGMPIGFRAGCDCDWFDQ